MFNPFYGMGFGGYGTYFLFALPALLLGLWAQFRVQSAIKILVHAHCVSALIFSRETALPQPGSPRMKPVTRSSMPMATSPYNCGQPSSPRFRSAAGLAQSFLWPGYGSQAQPSPGLG